MNGSLAHKESSTSATNREQRTAGLDAAGVDGVSEVGHVAKGLRTRKAGEKAKRGERDEKDYVMETPLKVLKVLEALEGRAFEPATINRVVQRTGFTQSFCRSALLTLKEAGYAQRTFDGWIVGPRLARFAGRITRNSEKAESQNQ